MLFIGIFLFFSCASVKQNEPELPNVIFIMADDLGYGDVGFNGQNKIYTPVLDQLASEGMVFNRMYAGSTVCGPSRASLMTGLHTGHSTVRGNPRWTASGEPVDFRDEEITLGEQMKKAGYKTGVVGKWGLAENLSHTKPNNQGFDYFYGFNQHRPAHHYYPEEIWENDELVQLPNVTNEKKGTHVQELFTQKALEFIRENSNEQFFLYLPYTVPHYELTIPEEYKEEYRKKGWPLREMKPGHYLHDPNGHVTYAAMVSKMDQDVGRIINLLDSLNLSENTLVIFTSDNGPEYDQVNNEFFDSNGPLKGKKRDLYEGGIRMPFVAKWPGKIAAGTRSDHIAAFWDVKATLSDLTNIPLTETTDGISFLPALTGNKMQKEHDYLYWEFNEGRGPIQALLQGEWKLLYFKVANRFELYNLSDDIGETNNLIEIQVAKAEELKSLLKKARTENPDFPLVKKN